MNRSRADQVRLTEELEFLAQQRRIRPAPSRADLNVLLRALRAHGAPCASDPARWTAAMVDGKETEVLRAYRAVEDAASDESAYRLRLLLLHRCAAVTTPLLRAEVRVLVAVVAMLGRDFDEARRHAGVAADLTPCASLSKMLTAIERREEGAHSRKRDFQSSFSGLWPC